MENHQSAYSKQLKKILIVTQNYPKNKDYHTLAFIHPRLLNYKKNGIEPVVLSFKEKDQYIYEGIPVFGESKLKENHDFASFDIIVSHAPNFRNHFRFLFLNKLDPKKIVFVIHGQEVLNRYKIYPKPYSFLKKKTFKYFLAFLYDNIKLLVARVFLHKIFKASSNIFVSGWMKTMYESSLKCNLSTLKKDYAIIHNPVSEAFLKQAYIPIKNDNVVMIRPLDDSKYAIDVAVKVAQQNPQLTFHIYGQGEFFKHVPQPENVINYQQFFHQKDIPELLNKYSYAMMLTRLDSQGVMACEMATYGIPLITSDIAVCKEMLAEFPNVGYIHNEDTDFKLKTVLGSIKDGGRKVTKFDADNLCKKELEFFEKIINKK